MKNILRLSKSVVGLTNTNVNKKNLVVLITNFGLNIKLVGFINIESLWYQQNYSFFYKNDARTKTFVDSISVSSVQQASWSGKWHFKERRSRRVIRISLTQKKLVGLKEIWKSDNLSSLRKFQGRKQTTVGPIKSKIQSV